MEDEFGQIMRVLTSRIPMMDGEDCRHLELFEEQARAIVDHLNHNGLWVCTTDELRARKPTPKPSPQVIPGPTTVTITITTEETQ